MKPLLAHLYSEHRVIYPCYTQPKLNGVRALYQMGHFQSRDELPWNPSVVAHLTEPLRKIFPDNVILDGELYVHGWTLQEINGAIAVNRLGPSDRTQEIEFHVFDSVDRNKPFEIRYELVSNLLQQTTHLHKAKPVETHKVHNEDLANIYYKKWVDLGYEGAMYRLGENKYTEPKSGRGVSDKNNRTWSLLKRKGFLDHEFEIFDVEEGLGKRSNMVGALVCKTPEGKFFRVGTGLTEHDATFYFQNPPIGKHAKIQYLCLSLNKIPLNPSLLSIS